MSDQDFRPHMITVEVMFFARLKELAATSRVEFKTPKDIKIGELRDIVVKRYPQLKAVLPNVIVAVNQKFASDDELITDDCEVAFFPPVSGGAGRTKVAITTEVIDINQLLEEATEKTTGAAAIFTGIIRGETGGEKPYQTVGLEYESYKPMAVAKLEQIGNEIRNQWPDVDNLVLIQRIGYMDAGIPTVVVICTSGHRNSGIFAAAKYGIDRIKEIVPVWKKEIGPDGESWVEGNYFPGTDE